MQLTGNQDRSIAAETCQSWSCAPGWLALGNLPTTKNPVGHTGFFVAEQFASEQLASDKYGRSSQQGLVSAWRRNVGRYFKQIATINLIAK